ncbi:MAG: sulfur carrier protein ThiS [Nitrospirae bacterium]|nr:sulfur carrier protein ThiS [Nitrospirota bacterium]MBI5695211.1 sulfur carrier protein ThiS [Nitrospirota bacterium]
MNITVNGEKMDIPEGTSAAELIGVLGLSDKRVAVELNRVILQAGSFAGTVLGEGDTLEVLSFVGGG